MIIDALGIKRQQVEGIRNPTLDPLEQLETDGGHARRLAERYLHQIGRKVTESASVAELPAASAHLAEDTAHVEQPSRARTPQSNGPTGPGERRRGGLACPVQDTGNWWKQA